MHYYTALLLLVALALDSGPQDAERPTEKPSAQGSRSGECHLSARNAWATLERKGDILCVAAFQGHQLEQLVPKQPRINTGNTLHASFI